MRYEINCYVLFGWTWGLKELHNIWIYLHTLNKEIKKHIFNSDIFFVLDSSCKSLQFLTWEQTAHKVLMTQLQSTESYLYLTINVMWDMKLCCWTSSSWHLERSNSLHLKGQAVQDWHDDGKLYWPSDTDTASHSRRHKPSATLVLWELQIFNHYLFLKPSLLNTVPCQTIYCWRVSLYLRNDLKYNYLQCPK